MKNRHGLDTEYHTEKLGQLLRDIGNYTPAEFARALARLSVTADANVISEPEFKRIGGGDGMTDHDRAKQIAPEGATHYFLHKNWEHHPSYFMLNDSGWFQYILGDWRRRNYDPARNYKIRRID